MAFVDAVVPADHPVVRYLAAQPGNVPFDITADLPYWRDEDVRKFMGARGHSFFSTYKKMATLLFWNDAARRIEAAAYFGPMCEGPIGHVHGGAIATMFDHVLGYTVLRTAGMGQSTLQLSVAYRKFVPLDSVVRMTCYLDRTEGRKSWLKGQITNQDGTTVHATCEALFYRVQEHVTTYEAAVRGPAGRNGLSKEQYLEHLRQRKLPVLNTVPQKSNL